MFVATLLSIILISNVIASDLDIISILDVDNDASRSNTRSIEYRLPSSVIPTHYNISLDVYFDENPSGEPYTFDGVTEIYVQVLEAGVTQIILHENLYQLQAISVSDSSGFAVLLNTTTPYEQESLYHFLKINFITALTENAVYKITVAYIGKMNETPLSRGMFKGYYTDSNGNEKIYAATHFQPYNARQVYPCFDEPAFKATFRLYITRPASYIGTYSNTEVENSTTLDNGRVKMYFYQTPKMSSYLLTMIISEDFISIAEDNTLAVPLRILARSNAVGLGEHALELAVKLVSYFENTFNISYGSMGEHLTNDHAAVPDWASGGTENWGLVSYRELYLLYDSAETIMNTEQYMATIISHELNHKWFGNLITCDWWNNTWINEGFASYYGYYGAHASANPMVSLATDSTITTPPLSNPNVNAPAEVTRHFGTITYAKGAAFVRMVHDMLTEDTFNKALQIFLSSRAYDIASPSDLFDAFFTAAVDDNALAYLNDFDFYGFLQNWVEQAGHPYLYVNVNMGTGELSMEQERSYLSSAAVTGDELWQIPITYAAEYTAAWNDLTPIHIMTTKTHTLNKASGHEWVIFNVQRHGYYRVNYDDHNWSHIRYSLRFERDTIHHLNRAAIVDDMFAFMRSGKVTYKRGLQLLDFLAGENNYHVWDAAITGFTWLRNRLRHLPEAQGHFDKYLLGLMEHVIADLGYEVGDDETSTVSMARLIVLAFATELGHAGLVQDSIQKFSALKTNGVWVNPHIRRHVFSIGIREGDYQDYQFLYNRMITSNIANDQLIMLRSLAATKNSTTLLKYLEMTLTSVVKPHDKINAYNYALLGNKDNSKTVLQFVMANAGSVREAYINQLATVFSNLAAYLTDEADLTTFETWLIANQDDFPEYTTGVSAIAVARANRNWGTERADEILAAVGVSSGSKTNHVSSAIIITLVVTNLLLL